MKKKLRTEKGLELWTFSALGQHSILFATNDLSFQTPNLILTIWEVSQRIYGHAWKAPLHCFFVHLGMDCRGHFMPFYGR